MSPDAITVHRPGGSLGEDPDFKLSFAEQGLPVILIALSIAGAAAVFAWFASGEGLGIHTGMNLVSKPAKRNRRRKR